MIQTSEEFTSIVSSISAKRKFSTRVQFLTSNNEIDGTTIQSIKYEETTSSNDSLEMGCASSSKVTIDLINPPTNITYDNARIKVFVGLELLNGQVEEVCLGVFNVTSCTTENDFATLRIEAYDNLIKLDKVYVPRTTINTLQDLYSDFKQAMLDDCGVVLNEYSPIHFSKSLSEYALPEFAYVEDATYQQTLCYLAGCLGGYAKCKRDGTVEISWYKTTNVVVDRDVQYMNGLKRLTENTLTITSIQTGTSNNPISIGDGENGTAIKFTNPYITVDMVEDIYASVGGSSYLPCDVKWRGNPALETGDIVEVVDKNEVNYLAYVTSIELNVSGGLSQKFVSCGSNKTESNFRNKYTTATEKFDVMYTKLQQSILDATNKITGNTGGYVIINDTNGDGKPDEILIMDAEQVENAINVWRWNQSGLGHSKRGYNGPYETAITQDGKINANFITTGQLNAERVLVGDQSLDSFVSIENGVIKIGEKNSTTIWQMENDSVAFYDVSNASNPVPTFRAYPNGIDMINMEGGRLRLQNFAFFFRPSGHLSFGVLKDEV